MSHLEVTFLGTVIPFKPDEEIRVGRDQSWADIILANDLRAQGVGREHCILKPGPGCYTLDLNDRNGVWVDGKRASDGDELPLKCILSLSEDETVPSLELELKGEADLEGTEDIDGRNVPRHERTQKQLYIVAGLIVLFLVIGVWIVLDMMPKTLSEANVERIKASTYAILVPNQTGGYDSGGTAWVGAEGVLVTNIHVARRLLNRRGGPAIARSTSDTPVDHEIVGREYHPAYSAYPAFLAEHEPLAEQSRAVQNPKGYDIALLYVADPENLAPPLAIAADAANDSVGTGEPLIIVGFPHEGLEQVGGGFNPAKPDPVPMYGSFVKATTFLLTDDIEGANHLMWYDMTTAGGNSGSPVVNMDGEVVALHFAGAKTTIGDQRIPVYGANYGQRADLVQDLLEAGSDETVDLSGYQQAWTEWLDGMPTLAEQAVSSLVRTALPGSMHCKFELTDLWATADRVSDTRRRLHATVDLPAPGEYLLIAYSLDASGKKIDLLVKGNGKNVFKSKTVVKSHHYDTQHFTEPATKLDIQLGGPAGEGTYTLAIHAWTESGTDCALNGFQQVM